MFRKLTCSLILLFATAAPAIAAQNLKDSFSLAIIPDTQYLSESNPATFNAMTEWIVDQSASKNIAFTTHVGDLVENGSSQQEWANASAAMAKLDGVMPYGVSMGNHDLDTLGGDRSTNFRSYFPESRMKQSSTFQETSPDGLSSYHKFNGGGQDFLSLHLDIDVSASGLNWAQNVLDANKNTPTLLTTHSLVSNGTLKNSPVIRSGGSWAQTVWDTLVAPNEQVFATFNGHTPGVYHDVVQNNSGLGVHRFMVDYQFYNNKNSDLVGLLTFNADENQLDYQAYHTIDGTSAGSAPDKQFSHNIQFDARFNNTLPQPGPDPDSDPPGTRRVTFRNGDKEYDGAVDTHVTDGPDNWGDTGTFYIDGDQGKGTGLIRFDDIVGEAPGQIPNGAQIVNAKLQFLTGGDQYAPSDTGARLHRMLVDWDESATWASLDDGLQVGVETLADADDSVAPISLGPTEFDVTESVQAFVDGEPNFGWAMIANDANGWFAFTSEYEMASSRPRLVVEYVPEPSSLLLLGLGGLALARRRRA